MGASSPALAGAGTVPSRRPSARSAACDSCTWVTAAAWLRGTDLVATAAGVSRGIMLWRVGRPRAAVAGRGEEGEGDDVGEMRRMEAVGHVPCRGFVNGLSFTPCGRHLVAAVGTEHWAGRWWRLRHSEAKNGLLVVDLPEALWESSRRSLGAGGEK